MVETFSAASKFGGTPTSSGGTTPEARNIISGNSYYGIDFEILVSGEAQNNLVEGNYIGTDITGTMSLGQQFYGILLNGSNTTIGGSTAGGRQCHPAATQAMGASSLRGPGNFTDPNSYSFEIPTGDYVEGNYIGTDPTGTQVVGKTTGPRDCGAGWSL